MIIPIRYLLSVLVAMWPSMGFATGWTDFERDIGHGFRISNYNLVCLYYDKSSALVCGDQETGDYGTISGFAFTDKHLLVRTTGTKPSGHEAFNFTNDWDRELFFIVDRRISNPYRYTPLGPLDSVAFKANPAVPAQIEWQLPTRFPSHEGELSFAAKIALTIVAWLVVLGSFLFWPVIAAVIAWWFARRIYRWTRTKA